MWLAYIAIVKVIFLDVENSGKTRIRLIVFSVMHIYYVLSIMPGAF